MIVTRNDVIAKLEDRLAGRIGAGALAAWAFDLFYRLDQDELEVADQDVDAVAAVLDELLFADDERFALDETDLRRLLQRLTQP
jgi:hypothetical protein